MYRGRHRLTGQSAAIKILEQRTGDSEHRQRCERELQLAAAVKHPGIVQVFDAGQDPESGDYYLAMELLEGRPLGDCIDDPAADLHMLVRYLRLLLEPLAAAHAAGIAHRDLKPDNVFVLSGDTPVVKLLDFGIAKGEASPRLTQTGTALGTPGYMSPEQAMGKPISPATDIWAVGVMLYEVLTGEHPFDAETAPAVIVAACTRPHVPVRERAPEVDPLLASLADRCLEKEAVDRPRDAQALLLELNRALGLGSLPPARRSARPPADNRALQRPPAPHGDATVQLGPIVGPTSSGVRAIRPLVSRGPQLARWAALGMGWLGVTGVLVAVAGTAVGLAAGAGILLTSALSIFVAKSLYARTPAPKHAPRVQTPVVAKYESEAPPPTLGDVSAPVSLVFFCDLTDSASKRAKATMDKVFEQYRAQLRVAFRHVPKRTSQAERVAEAAAEVYDQRGHDVFWEFVGRLLGSTKRPNKQRVEDLFEELGFNPSSLRYAWKSGRNRARVEEDCQLAETLGVQSVPAFLLEGRVFDGDMPAAVLCDAIEAILAPEPPPSEANTQVQDLNGFSEWRFDHILIQWTAVQGSQLHVARSRDEARERAQRLAARARADRADLEELGRTFGDGPSTAIGVEALPQSVWEAAARLRPGKVSDVLESSQGFHILRRQ